MDDHIIYRNFTRSALIPALRPLTAGIRGRLPHAVMSLLVGNRRDTGSGSRLLGGLFDVPPHTPWILPTWPGFVSAPRFSIPRRSAYQVTTYIHTKGGTQPLVPGSRMVAEAGTQHAWYVELRVAVEVRLIRLRLFDFSMAFPRFHFLGLHIRFSFFSFCQTVASQITDHIRTTNRDTQYPSLHQSASGRNPWPAGSLQEPGNTAR